MSFPDWPAARAAMLLDPTVVNLNTGEMRKRLWDRRIEAVIGEWPDGLNLRLSTHVCNTEEEIDRLAEALPEILA